MAETAMNYDYPDASPEKVWAILREVAQQMQETDKIIKEVAEGQKETRLQMQETDRRMKETDRKMQETDRQMRETDRQMRETDRQMRETDRQMKETDRRMKETVEKFGKLSNRFGELAEHLVIPNIMEKFNALGFTFTRSGPNVKIAEVSGKRIAELDILLENGDTAIAVEVKTKPRQDDVDDHVKRMEALRRYADGRGDMRTFQGAIAGAIMDDRVRDYIIKNGFYAIEQTGDTVKINIPEGFKARRW